MFTESHNMIMYDRRGMECNTDIETWNPRWNLTKFCCAGNVDPVRFLDITLVHHKNESNFVIRLAALHNRAGKAKGWMGLEASYLDRPYDRYHFIREANS